MAWYPRDLVSYLLLSPNRGDGMASGPGARADVVTRAQAVCHGQPQSAVACGARSRILGARTPGLREARRASVAPPLGQRPGVPVHCSGGPGSGRLLRSEE